jgi:YggT family protein
MADTLVTLINISAQIISLLIFARVILSFMSVDRSQPVAKFIYDMTEPILAPIRNLLPQAGMFDFSPMVAFFVIDFMIAPILVAVVRSLF